MNNIRVFSSEKFQFLVIKFSIYLNGRVFVMFMRKAKTLISLWKAKTDQTGRKYLKILFLMSRLNLYSLQLRLYLITHYGFYTRNYDPAHDKTCKKTSDQRRHRSACTSAKSAQSFR